MMPLALPFGPLKVNCALTSPFISEPGCICQSGEPSSRPNTRTLAAWPFHTLPERSVRSTGPSLLATRRLPRSAGKVQMTMTIISSVITAAISILRMCFCILRPDSIPDDSMLFQRDARVDQAHAFRAIGREIARFDSVIARQVLDPADELIKIRGLEAHAHTASAGRLDAFQYVAEARIARTRIGQRKQRLALAIDRRARCGGAQRRQLGLRSAHRGERAAIRADALRQTRARLRKRLPQQRPTEQQCDDNGTDTEHLLLTRRQRVPACAHHDLPAVTRRRPSTRPSLGLAEVTSALRPARPASCSRTRASVCTTC